MLKSISSLKCHIASIVSSQGKPCIVPPQSLVPFFVEVEKCFRAMSDAFSTQPAPKPLQLQVPIQQDVFHRRAKQQLKVLLTRCSASAYLHELCVAGGHLLTIKGMFNKPQDFNL